MMHRNIRFPSKAWVLFPLAALGCGTSSGATQCRVGADCASGACSVTGQCVTPATAAEAGAPDGTTTLPDGAPLPPFDAAVADTSTTWNPPPGTDASPGCVPNNDGRITRDEVPIAAGLRALYLVANSVKWDTTGTAGADAGTRSWDLTVPFTGDQSVIFTALAPAGTWWASSFTGATFAMQLEASQSLLGVFQASSGALSLIGVVSPTSTAPSTNVTYATPIPTLKFPFSVGSTWTTTSNVTGTISSVPAAYSETYVSTVDFAGEMKTPYGTFSVLRVGTLLTQTVSLVPSYTQSFVWVAECVGPVAAASSASSQTKPTSAELTSEAEVRRLTP